jgi:hypothetical protein
MHVALEAFFDQLLGIVLVIGFDRLHATPGACGLVLATDHDELFTGKTGFIGGIIGKRVLEWRDSLRGPA